ncbi:MAG: cyclic nucleotide-binding/CBS domain-containing protein [Candidatus Bathyarchaeia archaeon]
MKVSEVMTKNPVIVTTDTPVIEIARLMRDKRIGSVILVEEERPLGVVTERDLVHRVLAENRDLEKIKAGDEASKPVIAINIHGDVEDAIQTMTDYKIRRLVVVDNKDKVVGINTTDDLGYNLRSMSEDLAIRYILMTQRGKTN